MFVGYYPTGERPSGEFSGGAFGRESYRPEPRFQQSEQYFGQQQQHGVPLRHPLTQFPHGSAYGSTPIQQRR